MSFREEHDPPGVNYVAPAWLYKTVRYDERKGLGELNSAGLEGWEAYGTFTEEGHTTGILMKRRVS